MQTAQHNPLTSMGQSRLKRWTIYAIGLAVIIIAAALSLYLISHGITPKTSVSSILLEITYIKTGLNPQPSHMNVTLVGANYSFTAAAGSNVTVSLPITNNRTVGVNLTQISIISGGFVLISVSPPVSPPGPLVVPSGSTRTVTLRIQLPQSSYNGQLLISVNELGTS